MSTAQTDSSDWDADSAAMNLTDLEKKLHAGF
jgi:hypothetical protein